MAKEFHSWVVARVSHIYSLKTWILNGCKLVTHQYARYHFKQTKPDKTSRVGIDPQT